MFLEKLFSNIYGFIWLIIMLVFLLCVIVLMLLKKERSVSVNENEIKEEISEEIVVQETVEDVKEDKIEEVKIENNSSKEYEIVESEDGFYRVRKVGNDRTLRKFSTRIEAENYIEKRGLSNDR